MKNKMIVVAFLSLLLVGCQESQPPFNPPGASGDTQTIDIPQVYRVKNYSGGSCVFAAASSNLHSQHKHKLAKWVRNNYSGPGDASDVMAIYDEAGLKYTFGRGMDFLRACHDRRLSSVIGWPTGHVVNFVGIDSDYVYILDNNFTERYRKIPIDRFRDEWQGWCIALVEKSIPPSLVQRRN